MLQSSIALIIIILFIFRLAWQNHRRQISRAEYGFWLVFWFVSAILIVFIKDIDRLVASLGFSASGIQILLYLAVAWLFSQLLGLRLKLELMEKNITKLAEAKAAEEFKRSKN
jgi:hypothetical protein